MRVVDAPSEKRHHGLQEHQKYQLPGNSVKTMIISEEDARRMSSTDTNIVKGRHNIVDGKSNYIGHDNHMNYVRGEGNMIF